MSHSIPISRLSTQTLTTASSWRYFEIDGQKKIQLLSPDAATMWNCETVSVSQPSPLPLPPGHLTTKLCLSSIFIPFPKNVQCSKGSVTSGVREGGGCTRCLWKLPHGQAQDWLRHSQHYNQLELKSTNIFQTPHKKHNVSSSSIHLLLQFIFYHWTHTYQGEENSKDNG